ncbi:hypothetical protein ABZS29_25725 [Kribbella sp. NPDC005582]|uniref:hypothetical protein n=1 Tax=Kribbella sp. NPDC005582 TaxID=3156893 RepID=UPI0033ADE56E
MTLNWLFLIFIPIVVLLVVGPIMILKAQRRGIPGPGPAQAGPQPPALQQAPGETREDFVRRNWNRSGVVANGETLVDLYDRIRALEARLAETDLSNQPDAVRCRVEVAGRPPEVRGPRWRST